VPINQLYDTWFRWLKQLWPEQHLPVIRNAAWFMTGIYTSHSVQLPAIARQIPGHAKLLSRVQRLVRFLKQTHWSVRRSVAPVVKTELQEVAASVGEIRLIADGSRVAFHHQLLLISVAFRRRAIPIAWTWVRAKKGHSSACKQRALLRYVYRLLPPGTPVSLIGDTEFEACAVQEQVAAWGWTFVLRQKPNNQVRPSGRALWQNFGSLVEHPGERVWWEEARLTVRSNRQVNLLAYWEVGEKEPWLLATNLPTARATVRVYRRRMWTEELFGDLKGHGFDLESTHLCHIERLSRLTLLVVLLYIWMLWTGVRTIKNGERHWVDRHDRRDLSVFQIGWRFLDRFITNQEPLPNRLKPITMLKL